MWRKRLFVDENDEACWLDHLEPENLEAPRFQPSSARPFRPPDPRLHPAGAVAQALLALSQALGVRVIDRPAGTTLELSGRPLALSYPAVGAKAATSSDRRQE